MGVKRVAQILMERDGLTEREAFQAIDDTRSELWDAVSGTSCIDPEDVIADMLGLEPDYLIDLL